MAVVTKEHATGADKSFLALAEQQRADALVMNNFGKALALYVMKSGEEYTGEGLNGAATGFLGSDLPFKGKRRMHDYCKDSLEPAGMVAGGSTERDGRSVSTYSITEHGERCGKPAALRFLSLADYLGKSLNELNGATNTSGSVGHGYALAKVLECLNDGKIHTVTDIAQTAGLTEKVASFSLRHLDRTGLAHYKSVRCDPYGGAETDYSVIELTGRDEAEGYARNPRLMTKRLPHSQPDYAPYVRRCLLAALGLGLQEIHRNMLVGALGVSDATAKKVMALLCDLGVYAYRKFKGSFVLSESQITDKGIYAFELAYGPALAVAKDPRSAYAAGAYLMGALERSSKSPAELFASERRRFIETSNNLKQRSGDENVELVMDAIRSSDRSTDFRRKDVVEQLVKRGGETRNLDALATSGLRAMREKKLIKRAAERNHYRLLLRTEHD